MLASRYRSDTNSEPEIYTGLVNFEVATCNDSSASNKKDTNHIYRKAGSMMKFVRKALTAVLLASTFSVVAPAPGASAQSLCTYGPYKGSTYTDVYVGTCSYVQARIDRYNGGIYSYYGSKSSSRSYVSSNFGTNAGNAAKAWNGSSVSGWVYF